MNELPKESAVHRKSSHQEGCEHLRVARDVEVCRKWVSVPERSNLSSEHSWSDTDCGEEINSLNCASVAESIESNVSSLIDDNSVDSESDEQALLELRALLRKARCQREEVAGLLRQGDLTSSEEFGRVVLRDSKITAVLESSEDEACFRKLPNSNRKRIRKMSCEPKERDSGAPEKKEEEDEGDGKGTARVVALRHPLNDMVGKAQLKDDTKYEASDNAGGAGKRNHTDVNRECPAAVSPEKETQRPSRKSRKSNAGGQEKKSQTELKKKEQERSGGTGGRGHGAQSGTGARVGNLSEKVIQLLSSDSREELTAALLDRLLTEEKRPKKEKAGLAQKEPENLNTMFAVEGYDPPVQSNVRVIRDTKWSMGVELTNEFNEINRIVVHGEGFNDEVSGKLLGCQKQLVFESVIGQANRDKARDHWTDLMHAMNLGKKNLVAENYERLMYCLFMQECTDVSADGKLVMTNQVRQVSRNRGDAWAAQNLYSEEGGGGESGSSRRSGNYARMREHGGGEADRRWTRQGERNESYAGGRYEGSNRVDDRANVNENGLQRNEGNDNGLHRNDAVASNVPRFHDRFDDNRRRFDMEMNRRNGG